jgi:hypothetical protein
MKVVVWAGALAVGAVAALLLGLSMLAASQTSKRAQTVGDPQLVLRQADLTAMSQSLSSMTPATKSSGFGLVARNLGHSSGLSRRGMEEA